MESSRFSFQVLRKLEFSRQIFRKRSNNKCYRNPCCSCRQTDRHNITKLIVAFRNFARAPEGYTRNLCVNLSYRIASSLTKIRNFSAASVRLRIVPKNTARVTR